MPRSSNSKLTRSHIDQFLRNYIDNGMNGTKAVEAMHFTNSANSSAVMANYILKRPYVKAYLKHHLERAAEKTGATFENKVKKLWHVVDKGIDENSEGIDVESARVAISATAELNKMQGHYSPEKHQNVNLNIDVDVQKAIAIDKEIEQKIEEYKTGF